MKWIMQRKRWLSREILLKPYKPYEDIDYGLHWVEPKDIIALSLPPKDIANDEKMMKLRKSVAVNGWKDECPLDLHLCRVPSGKYTVCTGGNHRAYLAKELLIPKIHADISIVIPHAVIPVSVKYEIDGLFRQWQKFIKEAQEINRMLDRKGIVRFSKYIKEHNAVDMLTQKANDASRERDSILLNIAYDVGYIP